MIVEGRFDENLRLREPVGSEIVVCQGSGLIGIVQKHHRPSPFLESRDLDELRGCAPDRGDKFVYIHLHGRDQSIEVDAERNSRFVKTSDFGNVTLIKRTKYPLIHHAPLLTNSFGMSLVDLQLQSRAQSQGEVRIIMHLRWTAVNNAEADSPLSCRLTAGSVSY